MMVCLKDMKDMVQLLIRNHLANLHPITAYHVIISWIFSPNMGTSTGPIKLKVRAGVTPPSHYHPANWLYFLSKLPANTKCKGGFPIHGTASLRLKSHRTQQTLRACACDSLILLYSHIGSRGKVSDTFSSAIGPTRMLICDVVATSYSHHRVPVANNKFQNW